MQIDRDRFLMLTLVGAYVGCQSASPAPESVSVMIHPPKKEPADAPALLGSANEVSTHHAVGRCVQAVTQLAGGYSDPVVELGGQSCEGLLNYCSTMGKYYSPQVATRLVSCIERMNRCSACLLQGCVYQEAVADTSAQELDACERELGQDSSGEQQAGMSASMRCNQFTLMMTPRGGAAFAECLAEYGDSRVCITGDSGWVCWEGPSSYGLYE